MQEIRRPAGFLNLQDSLPLWTRALSLINTEFLPTLRFGLPSILPRRYHRHPRWLTCADVVVALKALARGSQALTCAPRSGGIAQYRTSTGWELWIVQIGESAPVLEFARTADGRVYELAGAGDDQAPLDPLATLARAEPTTYHSLMTVLSRALRVAAIHQGDTHQPELNEAQPGLPPGQKPHERFIDRLCWDVGGSVLTILLMQVGRSAG